jgi:hypothetical protein
MSAERLTIPNQTTVRHGDQAGAAAGAVDDFMRRSRSGRYRRAVDSQEVA